MKLIEFTRTMNTRDLGGYSTLDGKMIIDYRFIRSDAVNQLTATEVQFLLDHGITTSIDLRTPRVATKYRSSLSEDPRFSYHLIPIVEGTDVPLDEAKVPELYMSMLAHHDTFLDIFKTIAHAPGGIIYNCSAGKDRTGMVTFLLLDLINVPREIIASDYALSSTLIESKIETIRKFDPNFPTFLGYSKREYIDSFFVLFDLTYGATKKYLRTIGLSEAEINTITSKLLR